MADKKIRWNALLSSLIALFLCCIMLFGITYAWFESRVSSRNNQIKTGELDIEFYRSATPEDKVTSETKLFTELYNCDDATNASMWQPGVQATENIIVKNVGALPLKYELRLNYDYEFNEENEQSDIVDALKEILCVKVTSGESVIEKTIAEIAEVSDVIGTNLVLVKDAEDTFEICISWPEGTGNTYNNIASDLKIGFSLDLNATQIEGEEGISFE